ncbi:MAG: cell division protein ZapB [Myxococcota bacterium]
MARQKERHDEFDRLEKAVRRLVDQSRRLRAENTGLRRDLDAREARIQELDESLIGANQLRQDAIKRIDELLSQIDHLDTQLAIQGESGSE